MCEGSPPSHLCIRTKYYARCHPHSKINVRSGSYFHGMQGYVLYLSNLAPKGLRLSRLLLARRVLRYTLYTMSYVRRATWSREFVALCLIWMMASACQTMQQSTDSGPLMSFNTASNQNVGPAICQLSRSHQADVYLPSMIAGV